MSLNFPYTRQCSPQENPPGIRKMLNWLKQQYGDVEVLITENGYSSRGMGLEDDHRIHYYQTYLEQVGAEFLI